MSAYQEPMPIVVTDVYPPDAPGKRPSCEAELRQDIIERNEVWQRRGVFEATRRGKQSIPANQCGNNARYRIGDKWMCRKHAAYALLDSIATTGEASR